MARTMHRGAVVGKTRTQGRRRFEAARTQSIVRRETPSPTAPTTCRAARLKRRYRFGPFTPRQNSSVPSACRR